MTLTKFTKGILLYLFYISDVVTCNKVSKLGTMNPLDDCQRCKLLTDSFSYWIDSTSRGKHEGGDAAWEEAKLKSYARSELRLVEIQEGLCSELKKHESDCYVLAEEGEQFLEKWWFRDDPDSMDLHTWLCIENLKYCCHENHFGHNCSPCPLNMQNKVCGGHGRCDGEGTRAGNGTCICKKGYSGNLCDDCAIDFFRVNNDLCEPCHRACSGCSSEGAAACEACKTGWKLELGVCTDVNECLNSTFCKVNQFCINTEGSYDCKSCDVTCKTCAGDGYTNCTSCEPDHVLWSGRCLDDKHKSKLLRYTIKKLGLYLGLIVIAIFVLRNSKTIGSLAIIIIAMYIHYSETNIEMNILNVLVNLYVN
ncbi:cysteine-rich with EGF-like domain protein 2 [Achroia grisella]|uniref:cysteine-rich with EGF-like domain protein 2 n=1 Tax=Achroia grisella TaxID=688607 RepID=UPI0027D34A07|nr:cysteine-rich with EGF-like domain protein 2 [Achroia grisella]